jgi:hypothetical protein
MAFIRGQGVLRVGDIKAGGGGCSFLASSGEKAGPRQAMEIWQSFAFPGMWHLHCGRWRRAAAR